MQRAGTPLRDHSFEELKQLEETARLVLLDVGLHEKGFIDWNYKGANPEETKREMEVLAADVEEELLRRRSGFGGH